MPYWLRKRGVRYVAIINHRQNILGPAYLTEVPNESSENSHIQLGFARNGGAWVLTTGLD